jgi:hypothetical protein
MKQYWIPVEARDFSLLPNDPTSSESNPASHLMCTDGKAAGV